MTSASLPEHLQGKVALVTGATSGIGRAIARQLADGGMKVAACGRRRERLDELCAGREEQIFPFVADFRREADILSMFEQIRESLGGVDVLINNAGLAHIENLTQGKSEHWREMLDVNILALCICTREAIADMRKRGDQGHVVHVSSMAGHRVPSMGGVYSATKFAVRALTESLRQELRQAESGIRVSALSPGIVETEFRDRFFGDAKAAKESYGEFPALQSEDMANAVCFILASPQHMQVH
ncbi:MAG: SDR family NAD(P)-dependent oxidoreductase, partial [Myxococcales bacterium]|nr:SDR family NAD(P)-dependent oxidoreductase [Myxococcales bacterium]